MKPGKLIKRLARMVTTPLGDVLAEEAQDTTKAVIVTGATQLQELFPELMNLAAGDKARLHVEADISLQLKQDGEE